MEIHVTPDALKKYKGKEVDYFLKRIPKPLHYALKLEAFSRDVPMRELILTYCLEGLQQKTK